MPRILLFLIAVLLVQQTFPQVSPLAEDEAYLKDLFEQLMLTESEDKKHMLNDSILQAMAAVLESPESFDYPFDKLDRIGNVRPPDNAFRLFTWNLPISRFVHEYHGILQVGSGKGKECRVFFLNDRTASFENPLHTRASTENWPAALYYQALRNKTGKDFIYTLIGFHFNDRYSDKKIIDVLYFDEHQGPVFGKPVFQTENGLQHRVIFEYSGEVVMSVRFNPDMKMIVYDHLSPIEPELKGHPRFYAPDFSYDGYKWKSGMWIHQSDIDVRNR